MRERDVERYLVQQVEDVLGGICEKHTSPGRKDVPDRAVTLPYGLFDWVEVKAPGKKPRPGQLRDHARRAALGHPVQVLDTKEKVDAYIRRRQADIAVLAQVSL